MNLFVIYSIGLNMKKQKQNNSQPEPVTANKKSDQEISQSTTNARYSDEDLKEFRELIIAKLEEARIDYSLLKETLTGENDHGTDDTSPTFKLTEDASDLSSKEETALQAIRLQKFIDQLHNALIRIENKTYGVCSITGKLISRERLKSVPHTTKCVDAKTTRPD